LISSQPSSCSRFRWGAPQRDAAVLPLPGRRLYQVEQRAVVDRVPAMPSLVLERGHLVERRQRAENLSLRPIGRRRDALRSFHGRTEALLRRLPAHAEEPADGVPTVPRGPSSRASRRPAGVASTASVTASRRASASSSASVRVSTVMACHSNRPGAAVPGRRARPEGTAVLSTVRTQPKTAAPPIVMRASRHLPTMRRCDRSPVPVPSRSRSPPC
jgi:hypothetical protein